jgi:hypothetical protein
MVSSPKTHETIDGDSRRKSNISARISIEMPNADRFEDYKFLRARWFNSGPDYLSIFFGTSARPARSKTMNRTSGSADTSTTMQPFAAVARL